MLSLFGRRFVERAKSIVIGALAGLLIVALWQVSSERAQIAQQDQDRQIAGQIAQRFAVALTTYDYAHPDLQLSQIASLSSPAVFDRVSASSHEMAAAQASSLGQATDIVIVNGASSGTDVLVTTSQVVSGTYTLAGTTLAGLLDVRIGRPGSAWVVINFRWLVAPAGAP